MWIKHHHVLDSLRQIKIRREFEVFSLVAFADDLHNDLWYEANRFALFLLGRLFTKNGDVWSLQ
jgi:hypothetical protein